MEDKRMKNMLGDDAMEAVSGGAWVQREPTSVACAAYECKACGGKGRDTSVHTARCTVPTLRELGFGDAYSVTDFLNSCKSCKHLCQGVDENDLWCNHKQ